MLPSASVTAIPPGVAAWPVTRRRRAELDRGRAPAIAAAQRRPQVAVLEDVAHRALVDLVLVEVQEQPRRPLAGAAVADLDLLDRLRPLGRARAQSPSAAEHPPRAERQRIGAPVEVRRRLRRRGCRRRARCSTSPPCASASASTGPFSPPPTIRTSQSLAMARQYRAGQADCPAAAAPLGCRAATAGARMSESWLWMTAADLGRGIAAGAIDPRELDRGLPRRHRQPPAGAGDLRPHHARSAPAPRPTPPPAAPAPGLRRGPLDGVPVSWKDLFDTAGTATEAGSALPRAAGCPSATPPSSPPRPAPGLVCLGKTHMTELAFSVLGLNPVTATPPNINDPELAPGGSSSGAAASVAFGLAAAAIGSDTAGSVRVPAAWNDLVGLKTTHGALPLDGVVPLRPRFDTVGPLCRSVEDAALLLAALAGAARRRPRPAPGSTASRLLAPRRRPTSLPDPRRAPRGAFEAAARAAAAAGARLERGALAGGRRRRLALAPRHRRAEAYGDLARRDRGATRR